MSFNVSGKYPSRQFVEFCISREMQLDIRFAQGHALIAFCKGVWQVYFADNGAYIEMDDSFDLHECTNPLYEGFLKRKLKMYLEKGYDGRTGPSAALCDLFEQKFGSMHNSLDEVHVVEPGRNGLLTDGPNGTKTLVTSPARSEFKIKWTDDDEVWF